MYLSSKGKPSYTFLNEIIFKDKSSFLE